MNAEKSATEEGNSESDIEVKESERKEAKGRPRSLVFLPLDKKKAVGSSVGVMRRRRERSGGGGGRSGGAATG